MSDSLPETALLCQSERTAARVVDGKAVVVVMDSRKVHVMNAVGSRIWELADGRSLAAIADVLIEEFEVDRETAMRDVQSFAHELGVIGAFDVTRPGNAP